MEFRVGYPHDSVANKPYVLSSHRVYIHWLLAIEELDVDVGKFICETKHSAGTFILGS